MGRLGGAARSATKVVILSDDAETVKAVHEYLRFQIEEHKTGDPLTVE